MAFVVAIRIETRHNDSFLDKYFVLVQPFLVEDVLADLECLQLHNCRSIWWKKSESRVIVGFTVQTVTG